MKTYKIGLVRTSSRFLTIEVKAESKDEAINAALEEAGDHEFPMENSADYSVDFVEEDRI